MVCQGSLPGGGLQAHSQHLHDVPLSQVEGRASTSVLGGGGTEMLCAVHRCGASWGGGGVCFVIYLHMSPFLCLDLQRDLGEVASAVQGLRCGAGDGCVCMGTHVSTCLYVYVSNH